MRARPEGQEPGARRARAILWSCGIVGVFYLIVSYAQLYGFGAAAFGKVSAPLPQLASAVGLGWLGHFIAFGITCSMFACTLACLTAGSRMLLSFGHDGLLPRAFTHTSRHTHAPSTAVWAVAIPMTVIPIAYIAAGSTDTVLTGEEGTLATYGFMLAVVMLFVFYVNWIPQAVSNDIFPALAWPYWSLPYVFLAWTALGLAWYWTVRLRRPEVVANAGAWGEQGTPVRQTVGGYTGSRVRSE